MKKNKVSRHLNLSNTRKALRKQKRQEKKQHRKEHYQKNKSDPNQYKHEPGKFVKRPAEPPVSAGEPEKKKRKRQEISQDLLKKEREKEQKEVRKLNSQMEDRRKKMLVEANEVEDKMIRKLEKQLGLNKAKNKNNYFADDGLDYLLEICDRATSEQIVAAEKHLANVEDESDFEEDLAAVTGKDINKKEKVKKTENRTNSALDNKSKKQDDSDIESNDVSFDDENSDNSDIDGLESDDISKEGDGGQSDDEFGNSDESDIEDCEPPKEWKSASKTQTKKQKDEIKTNSKQGKEKNDRIIKSEDLSKVFSDDEISHLSGDDDDEISGDDIDDDGDESIEKEKKKPDVWEDIYGRKRDKEGNIIKEEKGTYIPPHLRNKDSTSDKDLVLLKRQIKSVLNKLSGTNLHWACTTVENLYSNNSRNSVNTALSTLWVEALVSTSVTPDRMVAEHAALVAVLHANVGSEIGAHFLQELTSKFDDMMVIPQPVEDKTLDNLISCLAQLYSFKMYQATLLYDILTRLLESLTEKHIDCILVVLRCVGGVLRKDEPMALKNFIHDTQTKVAALNENSQDGSRIKFLLEVLMAVKNNNLTKIPNYDPSYSEHLKKMIRGVIRKGNYVTTLNIRLDDLLKADERGKWWVVGSAWEGARATQEKPTDKPLPHATDQKLLELARKQRMNTDVRRSIFCVIMAAEDYMSAFEKLEQLGLRGPQQREISHVVLACCLQEKTYNPYYAILANKLGDSDRKYQLSLQFSVWDKIKDLDNLTKTSMTNLAQFLVHLIMEKTLPLSVLKIIEFSDLNKRTVKFMRQILLAIIMNEDLQTTLQVFQRIAKPPKLHMFRESLRLFIQHFLIKNTEKKNAILDDKEMAKLRERAAEVDKMLTMHENKLMF